MRLGTKWSWPDSNTLNNLSEMIEKNYANRSQDSTVRDRYWKAALLVGFYKIISKSIPLVDVSFKIRIVFVFLNTDLDIMISLT